MGSELEVKGSKGPGYFSSSKFRVHVIHDGMNSGGSRGGGGAANRPRPPFFGRLFFGRCWPIFGRCNDKSMNLDSSKLNLQCKILRAKGPAN